MIAMKTNQTVLWYLMLLSAAASSGNGLPETLPLLEEMAPGVNAAGSDHRHLSANTGWIDQEHQQVLIDLPRGVTPERYLEVIRQQNAAAPLLLALTRYREGDARILASFLAAGVEEVHLTPGVHELLIREDEDLPNDRWIIAKANVPLGTGDNRAEFIPLNGIFSHGGAALYLPGRKTLFAGPFVVNGPPIPLSDAKTAPWIQALRQLEHLPLQHVVPGYGAWGGPDMVTRMRSCLEELRAQIGHVVARGQSEETLAELRVASTCLPWMPYNQPTAADLMHIYRELRAPVAPFCGMPPDPGVPGPHALVLIGDRPHDPGRIEKGLRPVFEATGVTPHFAVDVETLTATNLSQVDLLVIFRDGHLQPDDGPGEPWMTIEQQRAVSDFVSRGGGFLNLHNAMGLYPDKGPYLELVGGQYAGHGPLERFRVEVVDPDHPVTRGVTAFAVADEQHTPPFDEQRCHLLLRNRSLDGEILAAAGWVREPGKGRLCYLANGHTSEALGHPMFQRLLGNAVNWLLRRDEDSGDPTP